MNGISISKPGLPKDPMICRISSVRKKLPPHEVVFDVPKDELNKVFDF